MESAAASAQKQEAQKPAPPSPLLSEPSSLSMQPSAVEPGSAEYNTEPDGYNPAELENPYPAPVVPQVEGSAEPPAPIEASGLDAGFVVARSAVAKTAIFE